MKYKLSLTSFLLICISIFFACTQASKEEKNVAAPKKEVKAPLNPNGDSELALLMRGMYEEAERIKKQVKQGEEVTVELDHMKILSAHATEPEKAASAEFKGFAKLYLARLEELKTADGEAKEVVYKSLVESCMSCHQVLCPGPMVRIKKLRI
jgi:CRISPR/Cas system CSM-associated protein Csm2 small subunit